MRYIILIGNNIEKVTDIKISSVNTSHQLESILNLERNIDYLKFLTNLIQPITHLIVTIKVKEIFNALEIFDINADTIENTLQLDKILMENVDKLFQVSNSNSMIKRYLELMFNRYSKAMEYGPGKPFMALSSTDDNLYLDKAFVLYELNDEYICYSRGSKEQTVALYDMCLTHLEKN